MFVAKIKSQLKTLTESKVTQKKIKETVKSVNTKLDNFYNEMLVDVENKGKQPLAEALKRFFLHPDRFQRYGDDTMNMITKFCENNYNTDDNNGVRIKMIPKVFSLNLHKVFQKILDEKNLLQEKLDKECRHVQKVLREKELLEKKVERYENTHNKCPEGSSFKTIEDSLKQLESKKRSRQDLSPMELKKNTDDMMHKAFGRKRIRCGKNNGNCNKEKGHNKRCIKKKGGKAWKREQKKYIDKIN